MQTPDRPVSQTTATKCKRGFHLNAITSDGANRLLIAGEGGVLFRSKDRGKTWETLASPYYGSWFGAIYLPTNDRVLVFGLEGSAWYSEDFGDTWQQSHTGTSNSLAGGYVRNNDVFLVGGVGLVLRSEDQATSFTPLTTLQGSLSSISHSQPQGLVAVGMSGIQSFVQTNRLAWMS